MTLSNEPAGRLEREIELLRQKLDEAEDIRRAISGGEVDAFVVGGRHDEAQVQMLSSAYERHRGLEDAAREIDAIRNGSIDGVVVGGDKVMLVPEAQRPFQDLIERMQQGAATVTAGGEIRYANERLASMLGVPREALLGASLQDFIKDDFRTLEQHEVALRRPDGTLLPALVTAARSEDSETLSLVITDLTERKRQQEIELAGQRKDEFLAILAHELRNPLSPIMNALEILKAARELAPDARYAVEVIGRQVRTMVRLIDDLLDINRLSQGKVTLETSRIDLRSVVESAIESARPAIDAKRHTLTTQLPGDALDAIGDPVRLGQAVLNLLINAAKYTPPGGSIRVAIERRQDGARTLAELRVQDDGVGIPPELLEGIFEPFVQARDAGERTGGLGLGLTVTRRLIELHGGSIEARSAGRGQGTEIIVRLPLVAASH